MSHFTRVRTQLRHVEHVLQALADMGYSEVEQGADLPLYGYKGDLRPETANLVIKRQHLSSASNDLGLAWQDDGTLGVIISEFDQGRFPRFVSDLTQRYAYHTVVAQAEAQGFGRVEEETQPDGSIRLVMRRSY